MAGNTKLIGFMMQSKVRLERWGKKTDVEIGVPAVSALEKACRHDLPTTPPDPKSRFKGADGQYDPNRDDIVLYLRPKTVDSLREIIALAESYDPDVLGLLDMELSQALADRERYLSALDEPGVE